jgi:hypothetical protein
VTTFDLPRKFRNAGIRGDVDLQTILDDRSRYFVMACAYRRERVREAIHYLWWATGGGRRPKAF